LKELLKPYVTSKMRVICKYPEVVDTNGTSLTKKPLMY